MMDARLRWRLEHVPCRLKQKDNDGVIVIGVYLGSEGMTAFPNSECCSKT
jgi:hypothetical protein